MFEHDWLIECFLGVRGLRAPGRAAAWQEGIDAALRARGVHAQWCMASPAVSGDAIEVPLRVAGRLPVPIPVDTMFTPGAAMSGFSSA